MTTRTRYFVIASLLVLSVGVGTGLVAYYTGVPGLALQAQAEELSLLPRDAQLVAYANVRRVMDSDLRQRLRTLIPLSGQGQRELLEQTGIDIDTDIEEVVTCLAPLTTSDNAQPVQTGPLAIARGRFDVSRLENLMQQKGGVAENYKGVKLIAAPKPASAAGGPGNDFSVAFIQPDLVALGNTALIRAAIDRRNAGGASVTSNAELMELIRSLDASDLWAAGDLARLTSGAQLPVDIIGQLPDVTRFAAAADIGAGVRGLIRADARNQAAADDLRQVIQGLIALGRLQLRSQPDLKPFIDSLVLGGTGNTVSVTFDVSPQLIDRIGGLASGEKRPNSPPPAR